jgi:SAM-dependent methyltransferase
MRLEIDIATEARHPDVAGLDLTEFTPDDLLNLILQRSEVMFDLPRSGQIIKAWNAGDMDPVSRVVETMGDTVARRAAGVIHAEYRALAPLLRGLAPKRIADIGCGYGFFDLFAARDLSAEVVLIDLESNERRHFGYHAEGAAYSSLSIARKLLESNGIAASAIRTLNPRDEPAEAIDPVDLAVSFLSCGFHYPVSTYAAFFDRAVTPTGSVIVDLRAATADQQAATLAPLGRLQDLPAPPKARRVLLRKGQA